MKLIIGLGNPGKEYQNTRHNLGFWIIDQLALELKLELNKKKFDGWYCKTPQYLLLKPQTYMNNSGECIAAFVKHFHVQLEDILVIYDEVALPLGSFRYRLHGSAGGHNGVKNIIERLGNKNFKRLRVGINYEREFKLHNWVLGKFSLVEKKAIESILPALLTSLQEWITENNFLKIMSVYNNYNKEKGHKKQNI